MLYETKIILQENHKYLSDQFMRFMICELYIFP